ncbi:MAG TPA: YbhB/YbcL family Raf kinase inhibitor-like protein [Candidatus Nanoarchaeia archaeon]|nr:YbhB/YbcL family Raf kinase inhibitor-like protein [Candidatus Nanoarchaeia archaeon]
MKSYKLLLSLCLALFFIAGCATQEIQKANEVNMKITSTAFQQNTAIPSGHTCDSKSPLSPPLVFSDVPEEAASLVLIMDDPDVPKALKADGMFDHWVLFNIPADAKEISEGKSIGIAGLNGAGQNSYTGPCPPPQYEPSTHRYFFKLYALDAMLDLPKNSDKKTVETAMEGHIIEQATLVGIYKRAKKTN